MLEGRITFRYDKNGRMLEQRTYNGSGELTLKRTLVYNELGQVSSDSSQYADDKLLKRMIFPMHRLCRLIRIAGRPF